MQGLFAKFYPLFFQVIGQIMSDQFVGRHRKIVCRVIGLQPVPEYKPMIYSSENLSLNACMSLFN